MRGSRMILFVLVVAIIHWSSMECKVMAESDVVKEPENLVTDPKAASSNSHGILQINSGERCTGGRAGGICINRCEDDNIQNDIACPKKIYVRPRFHSWGG